MVYRSLKDWNKKGKMVKKGERASARSSDGVALFSGSQVKNFPEPARVSVKSTYRRPTVEHRRAFHSDDYDWMENDMYGGDYIAMGWGR